MNVEAATIEMPRAQALEAFRAYRDAIKQGRATPEDVQLYRGFRALMRGQKILDVPRAIGSAGRDDRGRPRLAIGRADFAWVRCEGYGGLDGSYRFIGVQKRGEWNTTRRPRVDVAAGLFPPTTPQRTPMEMRACVASRPAIPPQYRPNVKDLSPYFLLWEAEWEDVPSDPFLLKHLAGPFYVILSAWDLSPLEQAVLRLRS